MEMETWKHVLSRTLPPPPPCCSLLVIVSVIIFSVPLSSVQVRPARPCHTYPCPRDSVSLLPPPSGCRLRRPPLRPHDLQHAARRQGGRGEGWPARAQPLGRARGIDTQPPRRRPRARRRRRLRRRRLGPALLLLRARLWPVLPAATAAKVAEAVAARDKVSVSAALSYSQLDSLVLQVFRRGGKPSGGEFLVRIQFLNPGSICWTSRRASKMRVAVLSLVGAVASGQTYPSKSGCVSSGGVSRIRGLGMTLPTSGCIIERPGSADIPLDWSAFQDEVVIQNQGSFFQGNDVCCNLESPDCAIQVQNQVSQPWFIAYSRLIVVLTLWVCHYRLANSTLATRSTPPLKCSVMGAPSCLCTTPLAAGSLASRWRFPRVSRQLQVHGASGRWSAHYHRPACPPQT